MRSEVLEQIPPAPSSTTRPRELDRLMSGSVRPRSASSNRPSDHHVEVLDAARPRSAIRYSQFTIALQLLCLVIVQFLGGDAFARRVFLGALAVNILVKAVVARQLATAKQVSTAQLMASAYAGVACILAAIYFLGVLSPAVVAVPAALYFLSSHHEDRASFVVFASVAAFVGALATLMAFGLLADRGLIRGEGLSTASRLGILFIVEAAFLVSYVLGRSHRKATLRVLAEHRELQARLMMADRLASMGALAAGVGHEINNPLTFSMTNLGLALEETAALRAHPSLERTKALEELLREALGGCERVRQIVRDLNMLSRQERPDKEPMPSAVDARAVLESALNVAKGELNQRVHVVRDYVEVPPVVGSEGRLGQVFLNLLVNAAQVFPRGSTETNELRLSIRRDTDARVVIEIADNGPGIPPAVAARVFDPFFTTKAPGKGTGLGLAICHGIVTSLGGDITLTSTVGRGTVVRVTLPVADVPLTTPEQRRSFAPPSQERRAEEARSRARVLIVDDEVAITRALTRALGGHEVSTASSGAEALARCASQTFDLILCDLMMPGLTGMDVHEQLTGTSPEQAERIVFVTGGAFTGRAKEFIDRVPNRVLDKPIDLKALRALAQESIARVEPRGSDGTA